VAAAKKKERPAFDIESPMAIELRRIMIRLNRTLDLDRKRMIMVTSSERGEGKSLFSLHFSQVLANHLRKKVLLVDGDMRRPVQHTVFNVHKSPGLAELLAGAKEPVYPRATHLDNLWFLPAGTPGDEPSVLLEEGRIRQVMLRLKSEYDIVLLDCPPVVPVSDPVQFVEEADGVLYLVMAGQTPRELAERGIGILKGVGANIVGVVANNLGEVLPYYHDHKYYGYGSNDRREAER